MASEDILNHFVAMVTKNGFGNHFEPHHC